jgi:hypothetical protein
MYTRCKQDQLASKPNFAPLATPIYGGTSKNQNHNKQGKNIMPKVRLNPTFLEFRGSVKDLTYRMSYGKTFASVKPDRSNVQLSDAQIAHHNRFKAAAAYGKTVMADPTARALYQQAAKERNMPLFALTISDFMNPPSIDEMDLSGYIGHVADVIKIQASDDFGVVKVRVEITDTDDNDPIESGNAIETGTGSGLWLYTVTTPIPAGRMVNVKVVATDRPGGTAIDTQTKTI